MPPFTIGLDLGTTALKAAVFRGGAEQRRWSVPYSLQTDEPGQAVQDYAELGHAFGSALRELETYCAHEQIEPLAAGFSNAMHGLVLVDKQGSPSPVFTWADTRAPTGGLPVSTHYRDTGVPYHSMTPAVKLAWLAGGSGLSRWQRVSGVKEELLLRHFGVFWTDVSTAAATGLMNLDGQYDGGILAGLHLHTAQLPVIQPVQTLLPPMLSPWRERYPRLARAAWVIGASDGVTATEGLGIDTPSVAAVSVGTSSAVRTFTPLPVLDQGARLFCYRAGERYLVGAPSNNGGLVWNWLRDTLDLPHELDELIASTTPGARGLLCLPYLSGERAPMWDARSSGALLGLRTHHGGRDIARAAMEGVALQIEWLCDILTRHTGAFHDIRVTGGLTRSAHWVQLLADILARPLSLPQGAELFEGSAFGAARIAARAVGEELPLELQFRSVTPGPDAGAYKALKQLYREAAHLTHTLTAALPT